MKTCRGTSRIAFVGESCTFKFPQIMLRTAGAEFCHAISQPNSVRRLRHLLRSRMKTRMGFRFYLLGGICENIREAFYTRALGELVVPTRLSLLGLMNIQDTAEDIEYEPDALFERMKGVLGNDIGGTSHTFNRPNNFGVHDGRVKLRDYGNVGIGAKVLAHQDAMYDELTALTKELST